MEEEFNPSIGDIVHFKAGSPDLLVICPLSKTSKQVLAVTCGWFDTRGEYREQGFRVELLSPGTCKIKYQ